MFVGIDHGTVAIRFACISDTEEDTKKLEAKAKIFELRRDEAARMSDVDILSAVEAGLGVRREDWKLVAVTYSMGDAFSTIRRLSDVEGRGSLEGGAGTFVGGGTKVFDAVKRAGLPAILIPGIHARLEIDDRMKFFSHGASPEKVGIAYFIYKSGFENFVFSDVSSNTVTVAVAGGRILGALDACIFAPGMKHGPLDLQLIRDVDSGKMTANEAFSRGGVLTKPHFATNADVDEASALKTLALFVAMELSAMSVLVSEFAEDFEFFTTGAVGEREDFRAAVERHLKRGVRSVPRYSAALGCALIARDVFRDAKEILGIAVEI